MCYDLKKVCYDLKMFCGLEEMCYDLKKCVMT